jgi:hypothetical protein
MSGSSGIVFLKGESWFDDMCLAICGGFSRLSKIFMLDFEVISDGDFRKVFYLSG